jgi:uncharacterized membrane protein YeaQ/YmgE (transglycosylase-associated protein family)
MAVPEVQAPRVTARARAHVMIDDILRFNTPYSWVRHAGNSKGDVVNIIWFLIVGLIAGFIARALVPGDDSMGLVPTLILGVVGSFVGGFIFSLFSDDREILDFSTTGLIGSILGAIVALLVYRQIKARA